MDSIGSVHFDNFRMGSGLIDNRSSIGNSPQDFADILKKAASAKSDSPVPGPRSPVPAQIDKTDKLYQLCLELETFLVKNLLTSMRNTVQKSGLIDQGFAGKMYEDMLYDEYAKDFTKNANFGLAEQAYAQLTQRRS